MGRRLGTMVVAFGLLAGCVAGSDDDAPVETTSTPECRDPCGVPIAQGVLWEPHVAVDPTNPDRIVASSVDLAARETDERLFHWPLLHRSEDGGATWTTTRLAGGTTLSPDHPLARYNNIEEPALAFLLDGTLLWSLLAMTIADGSPAVASVTGMSIIVLRSTDGGVTFPDLVTVQEGSGAFVYGVGDDTRRVAIDAQDKQWMAVQPDEGVLMVWSRNYGGHPECGTNVIGECTVVSFSVSSDGGRTWTAPATVERDGLFSGAFPIIRDDGAWVVSYRDTHERSVRIATSENEGLTWTYQTFDATTKFPVMAATVGPNGERLVLAYPRSENGTDSLQTVTLRWSDDGGVTWTTPVPLDAPAHDGRTTPAIAAGNGGLAFLTFWHARETGAELRAITFSQGNVSAPLVLDATEGPTAETGDYMGLAALPDGAAFAVWVSRHDGQLGLFGARITAPGRTEPSDVAS